MCKKKNKQKTPKKQSRKRKKKPKKLTSQYITPTRIKCMALLHFYFYINNCQLKLGVTPDIKATLEQELANSMFTMKEITFFLCKNTENVMCADNSRKVFSCHLLPIVVS